MLLAPVGIVGVGNAAATDLALGFSMTGTANRALSAIGRGREHRVDSTEIATVPPMPSVRTTPRGGERRTPAEDPRGIADVLSYGRDLQPRDATPGCPTTGALATARELLAHAPVVTELVERRRLALSSLSSMARSSS